MLFSGGGTRAVLGSLVAACALKENLVKPERVGALVGASGGALAVTMLSSLTESPTREVFQELRKNKSFRWELKKIRIKENKENVTENTTNFLPLDPCKEVDRIKQLDEFGNSLSYGQMAQQCFCEYGACQPTWMRWSTQADKDETCFDISRKGLAKAFFLGHETSPSSKNYGTPAMPIRLGRTFLKYADSRIVAGACMWKEHVQLHHGMCTIQAPSDDRGGEAGELHCAVHEEINFGEERGEIETASKDLPRRSPVQRLPSHSVQIMMPKEQGQDNPKRDLNVFDTLTMASCAWADASKITGKNMVWLGKRISEKRTPEIMGGVQNVSRLCDHGHVCNIPLSYLAAIDVNELKRLKNVLAFDFTTQTEPTGTVDANPWHIDMCLNYWEKRLLFKQRVPYKPFPWGFHVSLNIPYQDDSGKEDVYPLEVWVVSARGLSRYNNGGGQELANLVTVSIAKSNQDIREFEKNWKGFLTEVAFKEQNITAIM